MPSAQVHLGDLPANIMAPRLGDGVWRAALISLGLVVAAASAAVAGGLTHRLPGIVTSARFLAVLLEQCWLFQGSGNSHVI